MSTSDVFDLLGSVLSTKRNERMIGFAGFSRSGSPRGQDIEGMVKVSAFHRDDGSGYLTLTFLIDREPGSAPAVARSQLGRVEQARLQQRLGSDFEMLIDIPLSEFSQAPAFFVEEMDIYFRRVAGREKELVETGLFPAFADMLGLSFEPLQLWREVVPAPQPQPQPQPGGAAGAAPDTRPRSLLKRWLGSS